MADLYLKDPTTGEVVVFDEADAQGAANAGYQSLTPEQVRQAQASEVEARPAGAPTGLATDTKTGYDPVTEFTAKAVSGATFGLAERDARSGATAARYTAEHPYAAMGASVLGQAPAMVLGGVAGSAIRAGAAGASLATRAGAVAADYGINAAVGGAQIEAEQSHEAGENFSFTDAALAGVAAEVMGRGGAWTISKTLGGARNLITRAARDAVAADAERTLSKGGWVGDYRTAQHADVYHDQLADLGAKDLDTLETATAEVGRQDKKRARIMASVVDHPAVQHEINVGAVEGLQRLRTALTDELESAGGGPAKRLAKQLDERIAALEAAPKGKKLWRILDENRQALQEYRQDLHQAYDTNPGSAWLSREGLASIDAAEEATRTALLREDAWGEAAARMQREYNVPFHEKWFPARKTVLADLHFATGKDAQGFTTYRGEPSKMRKFLTQLGGTSPDTHRARELFTQYLDGAEAIARAGERDAPKAAREALESVRRLRKNMANSTFINAAAERTAARSTVADAAGTAVAAGLGLAAAGPMGGAVGAGAFRGARMGHWFGQAAAKLGLFKGELHSMAELLAKDALPAAAGKDVTEGLTDRLTDDIMDAPFPKAESLRPPGEAGPIAGQPQRAVGVAAPPEAPAGPFPGPGQVGRQETPRRPAGMEAITPQQRPISVGAEPPPREPGGGGFPDERPTDASGLARTATERPEAGGAYHQGAAAWDPHRAPEQYGVWSPDSARPLPEPGNTPARGAAGGWEPMAPPSKLESELAGESALPSMREGSEVPLAGEAMAPTHPAPYRTEGMAYFEGHVQPGEAARSAEAKRMQALTEGEFAHVVDGLNATGQKAPDGSLLGDFLRRNADTLKAAGLITLGAGASAAAADGEDGVAGASAGLGLGLMALTKRGKLGASMRLGAKFALTEEGRAEAKAIVKQAIEALPPPPPQTTTHYFGHLTDSARMAESPQLPGVKKLFEVTREAARKLDEPEQAAINEWVGGSHSIKYEQRTGLVSEFKEPTDPSNAASFESAMDKLTVMNPTKHGDLYRYVDLEDSGLAELLTKDEYVVPNHISTSYYPDTDFGPHELRFTKVDSAGALIGVNPAEMEMVLTPGTRVKVTGRYVNPDTGNFTFTMQEIPATVAGGLKDVGYLAIPAIGAAALDSAEKPDGGTAGAGGVGMGFVGAASLFKQARGRLVADVARRLFSPTVGRLATRLAARAVYSRSDLAKRQAEFQSWGENPQELVDRVAEGLRDVPPEVQPKAHGGVFAAAAFLKERLPNATKKNSISMRDIPVSAEAIAKYARYEDAALRPKEAWANAAAQGHVGVELMETTEALYPDLLAEIRVAAYLTVRDEGPPTSIQSRVSYGRLFGGDGSFADPAMSSTVAAMTAYAYEQAVPTKPGGGPTSSGNVSHVAAASAAPAGLPRVG